jgi:hypothetical protein
MKFLVILGLLAYLTLQATQPISPRTPIQPFEGDCLSHFETWLKATGTADPTHAFSVKDGILHIQGGDHRGYLSTKQHYRDYQLSLEYKWGDQTDGGKYVRNSGIMLHGNGLHGASKGVWMTSLEVQLAQGCEGDLIVIRGKGGPKVDITSKTRIAEDQRTRWDPNGQPTRYNGRQMWWKNHQPFFKELLDTRGKHDVASPKGQWSKIKILCDGNIVTVFVNGHKVNEAYDFFPQSGRICLQNEGHEVYFRNLCIAPLPSK